MREPFSVRMAKLRSRWQSRAIQLLCAIATGRLLTWCHEWHMRACIARAGAEVDGEPLRFDDVWPWCDSPPEPAVRRQEYVWLQHSLPPLTPFPPIGESGQPDRYGEELSSTPGHSSPRST